MLGGLVVSKGKMDIHAEGDVLMASVQGEPFVEVTEDSVFDDEGELKEVRHKEVSGHCINHNFLYIDDDLLCQAGVDIIGFRNIIRSRESIKFVAERNIIFPAVTTKHYTKINITKYNYNTDTDFNHSVD